MRGQEGLCTTSAPNAYDYEQFCGHGWMRAMRLSILPSVQRCQRHIIRRCLPAEETGHVYPVDSRSLSTGIGLLVLEACDLRDHGFAAEEIAARVREDSAKCQASFLVDVIEYLWKGGRCSSVAAIGANLLKLKPRI